MTDLLQMLSIRGLEPARWLIVLGIAYTLATTVVYFLSPPQPEPATAVTATATTARQQPADIDAILARNLFGAADSSVRPVAKSTPAVETRLPLELHGVFVAEVADDSAAIIAQKGKPGLLYTIGQVVPGNAKLVEVHADHIVLSRAGSRETLKFPQAGDRLLVGAENDSSAAQTRPPSSGWKPVPANRSRSASEQPAADATAATARDFVNDYRQRMDEDPQQTLAELGITPVAEGQTSGYRLGSLANSPYLSRTGLQPGDVILSVNGRPVGDVNQDRMEIENVLAQGSARLEVQRGTRRFFVTASLQ